jgi:hypothetical protein
VEIDRELKRDYQRFLQDRNRGDRDSDGRPVLALVFQAYFARPWYPCVSVWIFHAALRPTR